MKQLMHNRILIATIVIAATFAASALPGRAQGSFYVEAPKDGRIYVFNNMQVYDEWTRTGEMGKSITRIGAGPNGETLVFDSEEAINLYNFRHGLPGEVFLKPEEKKPTSPTFSWKDGKTSFEFEKASVNVTTGVQVRYTNDQPGDPNIDSKGSFRIRRVKTRIDGWLYQKWIGYEVALSFVDPNNSVLDDAAINYDVTKGKRGFMIKGGQFKVPFGRQELTSDGALQFVDRVIVADEFDKSRDIGVQLWGQTPKGTLEWRGGIFNGGGRNRTANDNSKFQYDARLTWQPWGDVKYSECDFESTTHPLVAFAVEFEKNDMHGATAGDDIDREVYGGDIVFKFKGLSIFAEYIHRVSEPEVAAEFRSDGFDAEIGYFVYKRHVEVALRYATLDLNVLSGISDDQQHEKGAAVNWFMNKHYLKLTADYRLLENDVTGFTNDQVRLQMQFVF